MTDRRDYRLVLASARAELIEGDGLSRPGVPDLVTASWRRSLTNGISPVSLRDQHVTDLDLGTRLVRCARPVMERLCDQVADVPLCVVLTDGKARIVLRKDSTLWISKVLDRVHFAQGFDYAEDAVGTNGVGTVLEFGASVQIVGAEHFVESLQAFACTGAPVRDPFSGRIEGVLDITCLQDQYTPIMHSLVRSAAAEVERAMIQDRNQSQQALFDAYSRTESRTREAVFAVGPRVTMSNTALSALLDSSDQAALADHMRFLMDRRSERVDDRVDLPSGTEVRLRGSSAAIGGDVAGMVGVVTRCPDVVPGSVASPGDPARPAAARAVEPGHGWASPTWIAASARAVRALHLGRPVLVLGEPGSGRATLLSEAFRALAPHGRIVSLASEELDVAGVTEELEDLCRGPAAGPDEGGGVLVLLHDLDRLTSETGSLLRDALERLPSGVRLAATGLADRPDPEQPLLALFRESTTVPALRNRVVDLPRLAESLLGALAPERRVRLSDEVLRTLSRHPWPGNVDELRDALASALGRRPVGTIETGDLPPYCQSVPTVSMREVDRIERDAIVAALRDAGGNRKAAAQALGLARSTLYRKISQYGITD